MASCPRGPATSRSCGGAQSTTRRASKSCGAHRTPPRARRSSGVHRRRRPTRSERVMADSAAKKGNTVHPVPKGLRIYLHALLIAGAAVLVHLAVGFVRGPHHGGWVL